MTGEYTVAVRTTEAAQAKAFATSGVHYAMGLMADPGAVQSQLGGNPGDAQSAFAGVAVGPAGGGRGGGRFSLAYPADTGTGSGAGRYAVRYGVVDEGGKLNLNVLAQDADPNRLHDALMKLPGMTEDIADSICDWLDADDTPRAAGAESSYYQGLGTPYNAKNGALNSVEELLLVKGVTPLLLFGPDRNRNGKLDPGEDATADFTLGWANFLTVHGRELNVDVNGTPRVYVNDPDKDGPTLAPLLATPLGQELADYVLAARLWGTTSTKPAAATSTSTSTTSTSSGTTAGTGAGSTVTLTTTVTKSGTSMADNAGGGSSRTVPGGAAELRAAVQKALDAKDRLKSQVKTLTALINSQVTLPKPDNSPPNTPTVVVPSPLNDATKLKDLLPKLMDAVTATADYDMAPRLNVNTATPEVLLTLPGLVQADVDAVVAARPAAPVGTDAATATGAWLVTTANLSADKFAALEKAVTGKSMVYRVHSVGYFGKGGPAARMEAVFDTNLGHPRILYFRDVTDLGRGFELQR